MSPYFSYYKKHRNKAHISKCIKHWLHKTDQLIVMSHKIEMINNDLTRQKNYGLLFNCIDLDPNIGRFKNNKS